MEMIFKIAEKINSVELKNNIAMAGLKHTKIKLVTVSGYIKKIM